MVEQGQSDGKSAAVIIASEQRVGPAPAVTFATNEADAQVIAAAADAEGISSGEYLARLYALLTTELFGPPEE